MHLLLPFIFQTDLVTIGQLYHLSAIKTLLGKGIKYLRCRN